MAADNSKLALGGYDALSYFLNGKPRPGSADYKMKYDGYTFCFSSQSNLDKFQKTPEKFAPQFGGNCAFACGLFGKLAPGSPKSWKIKNGKLYLNANGIVGKLWDLMPMLIERGNSNYKVKRRR